MKLFKMPFNTIYPLYLKKVERKNRTQEELNTLIFWLTGYDESSLTKLLAEGWDLQTFFDAAPALNPNAHLIKGRICGVRIEEITDPLMKKIRYLDKLVDDLAKGRPLEKILPQP